MKLVTGSQNLAEVYVTSQLQGNDREIGHNMPAFLLLRWLQYSVLTVTICEAIMLPGSGTEADTRRQNRCSKSTSFSRLLQEPGNMKIFLNSYGARLNISREKVGILEMLKSNGLYFA